jgi:glycosyltransferase involved in cell wall biosynthesis
MVTSFIAGLFIKTDLIIATSPQFFTAISGRWLAFWKRRKWIMEVRDLWPESLKVVGVMKDNIFIRFFEFVEHRLYKSAWKLVTVTNYMKQEIRTKHNIAETKIKVIRNGVDFNEFQPLPKNQDLIARLGLANKYIIGYVGTHGLAHGLAFILRSAAKINSEKIHFLFVGSGAEKPNLLELQKELHLSNVTFLDPIPKNEVKEYLSILDAGLVNLIKSPVFMGALPSKINELVAMRIPILLGVEGEAEEFIRDNGLGVCFEPENEESFLTAINQLRNKMNIGTDNATKEVKTLIDRKELAGQMLEFIRI